MKRSCRALLALAFGAASLASATPAFAQTDNQGTVGAVLLLVTSIISCAGIPGVLVLWLWMLVDVLRRHEDEFPEPAYGGKTLWTVVMLAGGLLVAPAPMVAAAYYFMVYRPARKPAASEADEVPADGAQDDVPPPAASGEGS